MSDLIQSLWIGSELSIMEHLSIRSYLAHGHDYHLYVYSAVNNIPEGTILRDGNEILPSSMIFKYKDYDSYSGFSNFFRYKLLLERGGWWVDTDTICLKPFDFEEAYVFSSEWDNGKDVVTSGTIKAHGASEVMAYVWNVCRAKKTEELFWSETGPKLMAEAVRRYALEKYVKSHDVFCPLGYEEWYKVLRPDLVWAFSERTYAIHLWNEMWRREGQDKNGRYHPTCLFEQFKRNYLK